MIHTHYLFVSDFDKTLSFDDGGYLLSESIGISRDKFDQKVRTIADKYFLQQGAELSSLIENDPDYKGKIRIKSPLTELSMWEMEYQISV